MQAAASSRQGQALETLTERLGAESPPSHVVTVGPQRYPSPCFIRNNETDPRTCLVRTSELTQHLEMETVAWLVVVSWCHLVPGRMVETLTLGSS